MEQSKDYFAFISYKREDEKWAKWLQHKLEHYRLPSNVKKGNVHLPKDLRPVFKDTSELSSGVLAEEIHAALENSQYLIVICSPRAAKSEWVCKEVQTFIDMGRTKEVIPFIVGGKAYADNPTEECFPTALRQLHGDQELLGININEMGKEAAVIKVIARMLGLKFDMLWQRHQKEKSQRNAVISAASVFLLTVLIASAWIWHQNQQLQQSNRKIQEAQSRFIAEKINSLIEEGDAYTASLLALAVLPENISSANRPYVPEAEYALRQVACHQSALIKTGEVSLNNVQFTPDGKQIVAVVDSSRVLAWDARTGASLDTLIQMPTDTALTSYDGRTLSIMEGGVIKVSEEQSIFWQESWEESETGVLCAVFSPDNEKIALATGNQQIRILRSRDGKRLQQTDAHTADIRTVSFSPDSKYIVTASEDKTIKLWRLPLCQDVATLTGHQDKIYCAAFSPDGRLILSASADHTARLWDAETGKCLRTLDEHADEVRYATFSPDGKRVATSSYDKTIKIWDTESGQCLQTLESHKMAVCFADFSKDGKKLVSSSWDTTIKVWDLETGAVLKEWKAYTRGVRSVSFSPDDRYILSSCWTPDFKIWDAATGRLIHHLYGHEKNVNTATFSSNGTTILTASADGTIKTWEFPTLQELIDRTMERFRNRELTGEERLTYYLE